MRKILTILVAVAAFASLAGVASADVASTITYDHSAGMDSGVTCTTPWTMGVYGQYGAQGRFVDGCTARINCPTYTRGCYVHSTSSIAEYNRYGIRDTMNMRIRAFAPNGTVTSFLDTSCGPIAEGCSTGRLDRYLSAGSFATVQCNGVRQTSTSFGLARDRCHIELFENYV